MKKLGCLDLALNETKNIFCGVLSQVLYVKSPARSLRKGDGYISGRYYCVEMVIVGWAG